ncbi:DUF1501 domain-containing protein [Rhodopirellula baltica]|uniref:Secreted protein containing DUF1501 n=1 Tax=Rhodopirellula baltica WH47 TaxID=991778 RepID=F2AQD5_RHOBT|nr:DUF1501 domain-containing protein [Rhodopirellula baltica]EGF28079.1 secreted protein containing DUF1501 [Rhodopirellula baltica WH47]
MLQSRRSWLQSVAAGSTAIAASSAGVSGLLRANESIAAMPFGKAEHVISIWLGGGMGQIDTFDPKRMGDQKARKPGSLYKSIDTAVAGVSVCEHLPRLAERMDRVTAVRTVHHDVIDEHAAATNRMHTGRVVTGTVTYPSLGSVVAHELGSADSSVPPYVLIGYPNVTRGPGFLGASSGYLYLTDTSKGPSGLSLPHGIDAERQSRREQLLNATRASARRRFDNDSAVANYDSVIEQSLRLSGPEFGEVFELENESGQLRNQYGSEFGQRCLLARRLVQRGVRFVEVSHNLNFINGTGWDVHNDGINKQHELIRDLDTAMSTLIDDLEKHSMLDKTLIMVSSEFGRPPGFDAGGGRGHQGKAFTCVLAGGGLNHSGAYGLTDELSQNIVESPVSVPDLFATVHASLGIDPQKLLYDGDRPIPITDNGKPIRSLLV